MRITIFPKVKTFPSQENKAIESKKAIETEIVEAEDLNQLAELISTYAWSPAIFCGTRKRVNFESIELITLDIDGGMTLQEASEKLKYLRCSYILATTIGHQLNKNGVVCDRFRIVVPLDENITSIEEYNLNWNSFSRHFTVDESCKDVSRFYFGCCKGIINHNRAYRVIRIGQTNNIKPELEVKTEEDPLGRLSSRTINFLESNGKVTNWHIEYLFACRDMKAQGYTIYEAERILTNITGYLDDKHDLTQLKYVYEDVNIKFEYRRF